MHRVELKVNITLPRTFLPLLREVPNAPCGVESAIMGTVSLAVASFLMHRVELKVTLYHIASLLRRTKFLMHRVELKGHRNLNSMACPKQFLMHRVELKVGCAHKGSPQP